MNKSKKSKKDIASDIPAALVQCPLCGTDTPNLTKIDSGLRLGMQEAGETSIPDEMCGNCLKDWRKKVSKGVQLKAIQKIKDNHKQDLWKSRIRLIKHARSLFNNKVYGESAITYEKYLKVLEVVYGVDRASLKPSLFQERPKEITIICSVLWDLMLIYDAHQKYKTRQEEAAKKLSEFVKYSPLYSNIVRKAEKEFRRAKNPQAFRNFLKACNATISRCFIASCAFESHSHPTVRTLCHFRDQVLKKHPSGRQFVKFYYRFSPGVAKGLDHWPLAKKACRSLLRGVAFLLKRTFNLPEGRDF